MNRTEKNETVEALGKDLAQSPNAILFGFSGLKVPEAERGHIEIPNNQFAI